MDENGGFAEPAVTGDAGSLRNTTWLSRFGTMDWYLAAGSLVHIVTSVLLVINGNCSKPNGFPATSTVFVVIATFSVIYKYSFTQVDARDSVLVYDTGILSSLIPLGGDAGNNGIGISYNLLDVTNTADYLSTVGLSSILVRPAYNSSNPVFFPQDLIFGPSVNASLAAQLVRGVLYDYNVESYACNTINIANDT
jgi:hypothetical protein